MPVPLSVRSSTTVGLAAIFLLVATLYAGLFIKGYRTARHEPPDVQGNISLWPERPNRPLLSQDQSSEINTLLDRMSTEQKVGQLIIGDISSIEPEDLIEFPLGAILAGGNTAPNGGRHAEMTTWLQAADAYYEAAVSNPDFNPIIPPFFGIDAVHGHNNVEGAVIFPHNIGLGAANDTELVERIGAATARALAAAGHDWVFAPTVAVTEDARWGRFYESYSQDPARVRDLGEAYVRGLQTAPVGNRMIIASAKHFLADGGTAGGIDRGDARMDEKHLVEIHGSSYYGVLDAGVATIMGSFSSWQGTKIHAHKYLLTDVLKDRLAFNGFIVGDWNAHEQIHRCRASACPLAINAGIDMLMAPWDAKQLFPNLLSAVRSGRISQARLDDAVRRILSVKMKSGLLDGKKPSLRTGAGLSDALSGETVKSLAREAVRKSAILLKNENRVLPLRVKDATIAVIGPGADSFEAQNGGWTLTWQGSGIPNEKFPFGETLFQALTTHPAGADAKFALGFNATEKPQPDAAILAFAEPAYAEFHGDVTSLALPAINDAASQALTDLDNLGVPTVCVLFSGRPLWIEKVIAKCDTFVAAWLPGTQASGLADLLFGRTTNGGPANFQGTLPVSWPREGQFALMAQDPLFPLDFSLEYD